ncbi:MAG: sigma-70 family RNA polymerase sigma factor [Candidatus Krumholzibacteria bacterium]|nr:sigma-70 family RNA polymerase sigma factor [Candidatus Krumholzibacteria bacterium]
MRSEDANLIERCLRGDEKGFEELLNKYKSRVFSICQRMVRNSADAEDLAQEVFVRTFSVLDRYDSSYPFSRWLYRITSNLCIDFLRSNRKGGIISLDQSIESGDGEMPRQFPSGVIKPDREAEIKEMMAALEEAIGRLPEYYRIIVILRHQGQLSYEEISDDLGIPLGTVKARIHRARKMIKDFFKERGLLEEAEGIGSD